MHSVQHVPAELLCAIYEAATAPSLWPHVAAKAAAWVGGVASSLQARKLRGQPQTMLVSTGIEESQHAAYLAHHHQHDPHLAQIKKLDVGRALLSCEVLPHRQLVRSEFYNEFWSPQDLHDLQGVVLVRNDNWAVTFAAFGPSVGHFNADTQQRMALLAPHMARALALGFNFDAEETTDPALLTMAQSGLVDLVHVDRSLGLIEEALSAGTADRLRGDRSALRIERGALRAQDTGEQERLAYAVGKAAEGACSSHVFGSGAAAVTAVFAPGPRSSPISAERCVAVVIANKAARGSAEPEDFAQLPASLRSVAVRLARGMTDKGIATDLDASLITTRTYVTRVLKRLNVTGRRELMQMHKRQRRT